MAFLKNNPAGTEIAVPDLLPQPYCYMAEATTRAAHKFARPKDTMICHSRGIAGE